MVIIRPTKIIMNVKRSYVLRSINTFFFGGGRGGLDAFGNDKEKYVTVIFTILLFSCNIFAPIINVLGVISIETTKINF